MGEEAAVAWLERRGYRRRRAQRPHPAGEIDLVARDGDTLCFVEIKARTSGAYGAAVDRGGPAKRRRLWRAASLWLAAHPADAPCRFDVLGLDERDGGWGFTLLRDAFEGSDQA